MCIFIHGHSSINGYYEDIFIIEAKFIQVFTYRLEWTSSDPLVVRKGPHLEKELGGEALDHLVIIHPRLGGELIFVISQQ